MDWSIALTYFFVAGAIALAIQLAFQSLMLRPACPGTRIAAIAVFCAACYALVSAPNAMTLLGTSYVALWLPASLAKQFHWLMVLSLVNDNCRIGRRWLVVALGIPLFAGMVFAPPPISTIARALNVALTIVLMGNGLWVLWSGRRNDLVESRRELSLIILVLLPVTAALFVVLTLVEALAVQSELVALLKSIAMFSIIFAFAIAGTSFREDLFAVPAETPRLRVEHTGQTPADRIELRRLETAMAERAFLEPGLTIGALADTLGIPEHRLRRLINRHLGYRNFAAFINDHRIDEAKRRLGDEALAREQITGLAFDLGFASLAPFNRAFRERVGMSPSEFRNKALAARVEA